MAWRKHNELTRNDIAGIVLQQVTAGPAQALVNSAVSLHRTRTVNITFSRLFFCSRYMTKHISPPVVEEVRCPRDIVKHTHSHTSERCLATALRVSASITTGQYVLNKDVDPKRLGSENNAMKEAQQARTKWHRWYRCSSTCSSKLQLYFSWNAHFAFVGDPSYSLVIDWRRSRSTRRSIHMNEPR